MTLDPRDLAGLAGTFLGDIGNAARDELLAEAVLLDVPRGRPIFSSDGRMDHWAFLLEGTARAFIVRPDHRQLTVRYARAGSMLGSSTPSTTGTRLPVRIHAVTHCTLVELDAEASRRLAARDVQFNAALAAELTRRLDDVYRAFAATVQSTMSERVAAAVLDTSEPAAPDELRAPITQQGLADALGTAREVVSRALREFERDSVLEIGRGEIRVTDPAGLETAAGRWWTPSRFFALEPILDGQASFDSWPIPVIAIDHEGDIVYANPSVAATFGHASQRLIGRSLAMLLPAESFDTFNSKLGSHKGRAGWVPIGLGRPVQGKRADGSLFPAEIAILPVQFAGRGVTFSSFLDISYRRALRDYLTARHA